MMERIDLQPVSEGAVRPAVAAENVTKIFGEGPDRVTALDRVSVQIRQNEFFTLLGPSGCGKTTLLRLIAGFEIPDLGLIHLDGQDITALPPHRRPVNTVFQSYALFPHMTVAENIGFGLEMLGQPQLEVDGTVARMLSMVRMEAMAGRRTDQLSGGQQQRVALARALAPNPKVLLLDEPLAALDLKLRKEMQIELKRLQNETGITFVFVTHDQEEALTMSDRVAVMSEGRILQIGSPREIYNHPAHRFVADFIGDINILPGQILSVSAEVMSVALAPNVTIEASCPKIDPCEGSVSVAIRPESANIAQMGSQPGLEGVIENIVYFGTATNFHIRLDGGEAFTVRTPSGTDTTLDFSIGDRAVVVLRAGQARILID